MYGLTQKIIDLFMVTKPTHYAMQGARDEAPHLVENLAKEIDALIDEAQTKEAADCRFEWLNYGHNEEPDEAA